MLAAFALRASLSASMATSSPILFLKRKQPTTVFAGENIHHHTRALSDCFEPGREILTFCRGPELLDQVRSLAEIPSRRTFLAETMHARAITDHTWDRRLQYLLSLP